MEFCIKKIENCEDKTYYTLKILKKLPEWFGNEQAIDDYSVSVREMSFWAAFQDNSLIGFIAIKEHYGHTVEIFVCGVMPEFQYQGVGKALYNAVEDDIIQKGCKYVIVKTLSDIIDYKPYNDTRKFYESIGFVPLVTLTEMWDEENPCLIMIKSI